jgi:RNA polymerase sigma factor (sigma-70 family)
MSQDTDDEQRRDIAHLVESLARDYGSRLERLVMKEVHDRGVARLILQDTYEQVIRRLRNPTAPPVRNPEAYLYTAVSINVRLYWRRRRQTERLGIDWAADEQSTHRVPDPAPGPGKLAMLQEAVQRISDIVDKMPPKQRQVFLLSVSGAPPQEIGQQLGMSLMAVHRLRTRANARCRERLQQMGLDFGTELLGGPDFH